MKGLPLQRAAKNSYGLLVIFPSAVAVVVIFRIVDIARFVSVPERLIRGPPISRSSAKDAFDAFETLDAKKRKTILTIFLDFDFYKCFSPIGGVPA